MTTHENCLHPDRQEGESFEDYKERRRRLQKMSERAGKWGRVLYASKKKGRPAVKKENYE